MIKQASWPDVLHVVLNMRQDDFDEVMATRWDDCRYSFAADCMRMPGAKMAAINQEGEPVAIGGVAVWHPGVGQAWLIGTDKIGQMGVQIAKASRLAIRAIFAEGATHRIQAYSADTHKRAHRWLKRVGFSPERAMPMYGKERENFICFSILRDDVADSLSASRQSGA